MWDEHDVILIGKLPEGAWTPALVQRALEAPGGVIVEGPVAPVVSEAIGMTHAPPVALEGAIRSWMRNYEQLLSLLGSRRAAGSVVARPMVARSDELDWTRLGVPIGDARARAWRTSAWNVQVWKVAGGKGRPARRLADWISKDEPKRGSLPSSSVTD